MEPPNIFVDMAKKIVSEREFFKINCRDRKTRLYKRKGNRLVEEQNNISLEKRCFAEIQKHPDYSDKKASLRKPIRELLYALELSPGFIKNEEKFMPPPDSIPFANGEFSFKNNEFKQDDNKTLRFMRLNASYEERYVNEPLPDLLDDLIKNGISNHQRPLEENDERYESFLDCISYAFYPGNPLRKFFFISGAPRSGKTTLLKVFRNIFGPHYSSTLAMHSLMRQSRPNPEARPDLYGIPEKLWIDVAELDQGKIKTMLVKNLAGNDPIPIRKSHSDEMKAESIKGKFFIVCNSYPRFDDRNDEALKERLVIFDWYNPVNEKAIRYDLADILNSEENRNRIATFFINRISKCYNNGRWDINFHPSFNFRPELSCDDTELGIRKFLDDCLTCIGSDAWAMYPPMPYLPELWVSDIHRAYINYLTKKLKKPKSSAISSKKIKGFLEDYFELFFPQVEIHRIGNGYFCRGVIHNNPFAFDFPLRPPEYFNIQKPSPIPSNY